jgi:TPR repeat protein
MKKIIFGLATLSLLTIFSIASEKAEAYKKGCDLGNAKACTNLGYMYEFGKGVAENKYKAVELYRKACNGGDALGCTNLGNLLE